MGVIDDFAADVLSSMEGPGTRGTCSPQKICLDGFNCWMTFTCDGNFGCGCWVEGGTDFACSTFKCEQVHACGPVFTCARFTC